MASLAFRYILTLGQLVNIISDESILEHSSALIAQIYVEHYIEISQMQEATVNLGYWAIRGLAERIRQILEYLGIPYAETKYEGAEGRAKWFSEDKPKLLQKNPAITLPYLLDGDKVITESDAIIVHLVYKAGKPELLGKDADEQVQLATVQGVYRDFHPNYIRLVYGTYNQNNTFENAVVQSHSIFEPYLKKLTGLLGNKPFFCGNLTVIDFSIADTLQTLTLISPEYLKPYPTLAEHQKRVWDLPELKGYFSSSRFRERPCNNYTAAWK